MQALSRRRAIVPIASKFWRITSTQQVHDCADSKHATQNESPVEFAAEQSASQGTITLSSTFNRQTKTIPSAINATVTSGWPSNLNMYCCGPTVYDHSHLGHAISYIRCDLVTRALRTFCNLNIYFAMNITDVDDKIISKSLSHGIDYLTLSN